MKNGGEELERSCERSNVRARRANSAKRKLTEKHTGERLFRSRLRRRKKYRRREEQRRVSVNREPSAIARR